MRKVIIAGLVLSGLVAANAHAMRLDHGRVLIKEGDPISKLQHYAGRADRWDTVRVCRAPSSGSSCKGGVGWGTRYQYWVENRTWFIDEYDGIITKVTWSK